MCGRSRVPVGCGVSCDGTWQKRGFSSLNGCVTAISMEIGKGLDVEVLSPSCKQCQDHDHLDKNSDEYRAWQADDNTSKANYTGSAPTMKPKGTDQMFKCSIDRHNFRYITFYGDGDSKSYTKVKDTYAKDGFPITKKECIRHVQKRVGTAMRKLKKENIGHGGK